MTATNEFIKWHVAQIGDLEYLFKAEKQDIKELREDKDKYRHTLMRFYENFYYGLELFGQPFESEVEELHIQSDLPNLIKRVEIDIDKMQAALTLTMGKVLSVINAGFIKNGGQPITNNANYSNPNYESVIKKYNKEYPLLHFKWETHDFELIDVLWTAAYIVAKCLGIAHALLYKYGKTVFKSPVIDNKAPNIIPLGGHVEVGQMDNPTPKTILNDFVVNQQAFDQLVQYLEKEEIATYVEGKIILTQQTKQRALVHALIMQLKKKKYLKLAPKDAQCEEIARNTFAVNCAAKSFTGQKAGVAAADLLSVFDTLPTFK